MIVTNPFSMGSWTRDEIDNVSSGWWALFVAGIIGVVAGGTILVTDWTVRDLAVFVGALFLFRGVFTMVSVPLDGSARDWSIAIGLLEIGIGIAVWVWPGPTLLVVAFFIGWYVLFAGIIAIAGSISGRGVLPYWGLMLAIGIWCAIYGVLEIVLAFEVKHMSRRADDATRETGSAHSSHPFGAAAR